jgi:hypothetical protein
MSGVRDEGEEVMPHTHRVLAVLKLSKVVPVFIKQAKAFVAALGNNPSFPSPTVPLATASAHIADLETAETKAKSKGKGAVQDRDVKLKIVESDLHALKAYVQLVADSNVDNAASIIQSASLSTRKTAVRTKSDLSAVSGPVSGEVHLAAKAGPGRTSYDWQVSTDQKTWTSLPSTLRARTQIHALTPATTYYFRHRKLTKNGQEDWGQIVSLLVR